MMDFSNYIRHDGKWNKNVSREVFSDAHVSILLPYDPIKKKYFC